MALKVDREKLDEFCPQLFCTLDGLGLFGRFQFRDPADIKERDH